MLLDFTLYVPSLPDAIIPVYVSSNHIVSLERRTYMDGESEIEYTNIKMQDGTDYEVKESPRWIAQLVNSLG